MSPATRTDPFDKVTAQYRRDIANIIVANPIAPDQI